MKCLHGVLVAACTRAVSRGLGELSGECETPAHYPSPSLCHCNEPEQHCVADVYTSQVLACTPGHPDLIPGTQTVERENRPLESCSLTYTYNVTKKTKYKVNMNFPKMATNSFFFGFRSLNN